MSRALLLGTIIMFVIMGLMWTYVSKQKRSDLSTSNAFLVFIATFSILTGLGGFIFIIVAQFFELGEGATFMLAIFFLLGVIVPSWLIASKRIED